MPKYINKNEQEVYTGKWYQNLLMGIGSGFVLFGLPYSLYKFYNDINLINQNNLSLEDILYLISGVAVTSIGVILFERGYKEKKRIKRLENLLRRELDS